LTLAITTTLLYTVLEAPRRLLHYALVIAVMAILRCGYAIYRTRRPSFLLFVIYGFLHLALLVPAPDPGAIDAERQPLGHTNGCPALPERKQLNLIGVGERRVRPLRRSPGFAYWQGAVFKIAPV